MAATPEQKLTALIRRQQEVTIRDSALGRFEAKILKALTDEDVGPTLTVADKLALLVRYAALRQAFLGAGASPYRTPGGVAHDLYNWIPADLQLWEPETEEYTAL